MSRPKWFSDASPCRRFADDEQLVQALRQWDNEAIACLQWNCHSAVKSIVRRCGLPDERTEEILNSATMVFLQKTAEGAYQYQGQSPGAYLAEIARRLSLAEARKQGRNPADLDSVPEPADADAAWLNRRQEAAETVQFLLDRLGSPCAEVIRLHHIEGYADEEVIRLGLTPYSTIASLKVKRSDCMKKLVQSALQWKNSTNI
ncbi:MAG: hypothetical protein IAE84_00955 [Saprospiraceae bacterium]|nr:hypothetical protein [Saprospiraceae bacterium]